MQLIGVWLLSHLFDAVFNVHGRPFSQGVCSTLRTKSQSSEQATQAFTHPALRLPLPTVHTTSERPLLALHKCSGPAHDLQHSRPSPALKGGPGLGASGLSARKKPCSRKAHPLFDLQEAMVQGPQSSDPLVVVHCSSWRCPKSKSHTVHQVSPSMGPGSPQLWCLSWEQDDSCSAAPKVCTPGGISTSLASGGSKAEQSTCGILLKPHGGSTSASQFVLCPLCRA